MTNRIFEKELTPTEIALMGYQNCEKCERGPIAGSICVMCR